MILIDASALLEVLFDRPQAGDVLKDVTFKGPVSALITTVTEAAITLAREIGDPFTAAQLLREFLHGANIAIVPVEATVLDDALTAAWLGGPCVDGPLTLGDCVAYGMAKRMGCSIISADRRFRNTDLAGV